MFVIFVMVICNYICLIGILTARMKISVSIRQVLDFYHELEKKSRLYRTVIFAVSWLPYHTYLTLTDIFILKVSTVFPHIRPSLK